MNKKTFKKVIVSLVVGLGVIMGLPSAFADTGGGPGGGSSNGNLTGPVHWTTLAYDKKGEAWKKFVAIESRASDVSESWITREVNERVKSTTVCKNSKVIWYLKHDASGRWVYNYSQYTHGANWNTYSTNVRQSSIEKPYDHRGARKPIQAEIDAFKNWDKKNNGNVIDKKPGYVIICSGTFDVSPPPLVKIRIEPKTTSTPSKATYNEPFAHSVDFMPEVTEFDKNGNLVDLIAENNLEAQDSGISKTNYGNLLGNISSGKVKGDYNTLNKLIKEAIAKDKARSHADVHDLSANNKAGMAEGGVLSVSGRSHYASITLSQTVTKQYERTCTDTQTWNNKTGKYNPVSTSCTAWRETSSNTAFSQPKPSGTTPQLRSFWQMLSVHCNPEQFNNLVKSGNGIQNINSGNPEQKVAAAAYSKAYTTRPAILDFGDERNSNPSRALTGKVGFYDKECAYDCRPQNDINTSSSAVNKTGSKTGAVSEGLNNNEFLYFRDNEFRKIDIQTWAPKTTAVVSSPSAPLTTTVTRWAEGTPSTTGADGGKFEMKTADGTQLFTGNQKATVQRNWETSPFSNSTSTVLPGKHNSFEVRASWASEADKPQVLNVKYEYNANVKTSFYTTGLGFTLDGKQVLGKQSTESASIQGKCYVNYGTSTQIDTTKAFTDNTGSGTTNNLDGKLFETLNSDPSTNQSNVVIRFARATAE